ncbi:MAG: hypothetical protein ACK2UW_17360 [Anaerolineales bacterium]|jgi:hypothetical protein
MHEEANMDDNQDVHAAFEEPDGPPPGELSAPRPPAEPTSQHRAVPRVVWQNRVGPAFWTITGILSLGLNAILIALVILLGREIFSIKELVSNQLVGGLAENFALMDQAVIRTNVVVNDQIPIKFGLPVSKKTTVVLTNDVQITGARVDLATGGLSITNAPTDILLPEGTPLDIKLNMEIPVEASIPVTLNVPVDIPLNQTELHGPFVGLQQVVKPYDLLLKDLPDSWEEVLCAGGINRYCLTVQSYLPQTAK